MEKAITSAYFNAVRIYQRTYPVTLESNVLNWNSFCVCWITSEQSVNQTARQHLAFVTYFPALGTRCVFSRAWHALRIFPRLATAVCFPALGICYVLLLVLVVFLCIKFLSVCHAIYRHGKNASFTICKKAKIPLSTGLPWKIWLLP